MTTEAQPTDPILVALGITVRFGGLVALDSVDLEVHAGQLVGLIGPNGAGKTTFIDALSGFEQPSAGKVMLDGVVLNEYTVSQRAERGDSVGLFKSAEVFEDLTVRENLMVAAEKPGLLSALAGIFGYRPQLSGDVDDMLRRFGLEDLSWKPPSSLSSGQRKLLNVAAALCVGPKVILLDEPSAGLDATESQELGVQLKRVCREGIGMLLVDHDMSLVLQVCDFVYVLQFGKIISAGHPDDVRADPNVIEAYLGRAAADG